MKLSILHTFRWLKTFGRRHIATPLGKLGSDLVAHPIFGGTVIIVTYMLLENVLTNSYLTAPNSMIYLGLMYTMIFLFIVYVRPALYRTPQHKRVVYTTVLVCGLVIFGIAIFYDNVVAQLAPTLYNTYSKPQIISLCIIAPILEELAYRYLLYDKWAKGKWGTWIGAFVIGVIFVIAHPIVGIGGFALYWLPTILFYITYNTVGLYGSIAIHIIFNIVALL